MTAPDGLVDLAGRWLGGSVIAASDESFGEKENLIVPAPATFRPGRYGHKGEIVDGWETRRHGSGVDWALVRLGAPGVIAAIDVDTSFFTGNHPAECLVEACEAPGYPGPDELTGWSVVVARSPLTGDGHNLFEVRAAARATHVRLTVFPDGGVARLRVYGTVLADPWRFEGVSVDLAAQELGGLVVASSDGFYSSAHALNRPGLARTMGEGWETRRRRDGGHDWAVVRLACAGVVRQLEVDTSYYVANASTACALYGFAGEGTPAADDPGWFPLLPRTALRPDTRHHFPVPLTRPVSHVRVDAFPDGGLSRLRVIGHRA
ncbi:allantoicase [Luedemannella flava]|uniref:Probable allantoicase n=1 Tax=Luedemannella flava TaxID=349316 RepID=A0ABN2LZP7_9ACTN